MKGLLGNAISSELFFVYGLIVLVVVLILIIIIIDRKESKKKPQNLFDTLNMKIIADSNEINNQKEEETEKSEPDIIELKQHHQETNFHDLEPIPEVKMMDSSNHKETMLSNEPHFLQESLTSIKDSDSSPTNDLYVESELEKTQAQIRVEEITDALKKAQVEEQIQEDKYAKFEEEQEKNAIISYNELKESFDKLYSENEKIQYLEDDEIPINIDELYQLNNTKATVTEEQKPKAKLDDFSDFATSRKAPSDLSTTSTFKSSPFISPVYGIQKPPVEVQSPVDQEIQNANQFLQSLKELKNNLD